jgi:hypothetical protein
MSRGPGITQRRILDTLAEKGCADTFELAAAVFNQRPSAAQIVSVRRAVRALAKLGLVISGPTTRDRRQRHLVALPTAEGEAVYRMLERKSDAECLVRWENERRMRDSIYGMFSTPAPGVDE